MTSFNWTCPYCNRAQAATRVQYSREEHPIYNSESEFGHICCVVQSVRCANEDCKKLQLEFALHTAHINQHRQPTKPAHMIQSWRLLPESFSRPQPDYIPSPLVQDYYEACRIRDMSPKASATLSRRCLQGMVRDFCGIRDKTLNLEIISLRKRCVEGNGIPHVQQDTVDAIDAVRKIGNIGAHMERDVNLIIEVEPIEAQKLIELIELLFEEWYVHRENRRQKLETLLEIAEKKEDQKKQELGE